MTPMNFSRNVLIRGKIECLTGLHIGSVTDEIGIGGADSPVILDRMQNVPIIPGSSLKGKMRALLELKNPNWLSPSGAVHSCGKPDCTLCITFGSSADKDPENAPGPTRLIVRDARPDEETRKKWDTKEDVIHGTEIKGENFLNRVTSAAVPRFIERVVAGSCFNFEMVFSEYMAEDKKGLRLVLEAMTLLEDNYLGGSGTRGYGKIGFKNIEMLQKSKQDYLEGKDWSPIQSTQGKLTARELLAAL